MTSAVLSKGAKSFHSCRQSWPPILCFCSESASTCWATMCRGSGGGTTSSTQP